MVVAVGRRVWAAAAVEWRERAVGVAVGRRVWAAAAVEWREGVGAEQREPIVLAVAGQKELIVLAAAVSGWPFVAV